MLSFHKKCDRQISTRAAGPRCYSNDLVARMAPESPAPPSSSSQRGYWLFCFFVSLRKTSVGKFSTNQNCHLKILPRHFSSPFSPKETTKYSYRSHVGFSMSTNFLRFLTRLKYWVNKQQKKNLVYSIGGKVFGHLMFFPLLQKEWVALDRDKEMQLIVFMRNMPTRPLNVNLHVEWLLKLVRLSLNRWSPSDAWKVFF